MRHFRGDGTNVACVTQYRGFRVTQFEFEEGERGSLLRLVGRHFSSWDIGWIIEEALKT